MTDGDEVTGLWSRPCQ